MNMTENDYIYEIIDNEIDASYCAKLCAEEFSAHNALSIFDQLTPKRLFDDCTWPLTEAMFPERLSFLVRHRSTGDIIGALIAGDLYLQQQAQEEWDSSNMVQSIPLDNLLEEMDHLFITHDLGQELKLNMVLHIEMCAIRAEHSGKGIAYQLCKIACEYAGDKRGFQYAVTQSTSDATRHIFLNKMNGKVATVIDPTKWVWKRKDHEPTCPYKDYKGGFIPNILINL